jgi:hypothetical protein
MKACCCWIIFHLLLGAALADDCRECCDQCGHAGAACTVCCLVPSTRQVTRNVYRTECVDICLPGPSAPTVCRDACGQPQVAYKPTCGPIRSRKQLVKQEVTEMVPTTRCEVRHLCPLCAARCQPCRARGMASAVAVAGDQMSTSAVASIEVSAAASVPDTGQAAGAPRVMAAAKSEIGRWRRLLFR